MGRIKGEPQLRAELEAAERLGISHRRLLGWEPASTTTYEHDEAGRLVRSVTVPESEWDSGQRDLMVALQLYRDSLCPRCGHPWEESTSSDNDADNPDGSHRYVLTQSIRCHACTASMAAAEAHAHPGEGMAEPPHAAAVTHLVALVPRKQERMTPEEIARIRAEKRAMAEAKIAARKNKPRKRTTSAKGGGRP